MDWVNYYSLSIATLFYMAAAKDLITNPKDRPTAAAGVLIFLPLFLRGMGLI